MYTVSVPECTQQACVYCLLLTAMEGTTCTARSLVGAANVLVPSQRFASVDRMRYYCQAAPKYAWEMGTLVFLAEALQGKHTETESSRCNNMCMGMNNPKHTAHENFTRRKVSKAHIVFVSC